MDALFLSKMVNEKPLVELDFGMFIGPTANYLWSLDTKHFFSIEQLIDQMRKKDTLKSYIPDLFKEIHRATRVSPCNLCDDSRPIMNTRGSFTLDEHALLGPQLMEHNERANELTRMAEDGFLEQLQEHVAANLRKRSDEDQS